jgi:FKBP-type peptidyl-prolyl cis-trans isomerase SlyD
MQISKNKVVTVTYDLHCNLPGNAQQHVETADNNNPLSFIFGTGMMIPGFEKGLDGKSKGDKFTFSLESDDAYGNKEENAIIKLPIDIFKADGVLDMNLLQIGKFLPLNDSEGNVLNGKVIGFDNETVTMDFNHPLAGHHLHFTGEVIDVREASPEEISHGHVH